MEDEEDNEENVEMMSVIEELKHFSPYLGEACCPHG